MKVVASVLLFVMVLAISAACMVAQADEKKEEEAVEASKSWLKLIDSGKYGESWDEAAAIFKMNLTKKDWEKQIKPMMKMLGKTVSRNLKSKKYYTSLPGAPDGEYVVIQYETSFEKKKSAVETITPMLDKDGKWRVSGYYIK